MTFQATIEAFFASDSGKLAIWILLAPLIDFLLGVAAAFRDNTFELDSLAAFLRKQVAGRILPIWGLLLLGEFAKSFTIPVVDLPLVPSLGVGAAGLYLVETFGSIMRSWGPTGDNAPALLKRDPVQKVPNE